MHDFYILRTLNIDENLFGFQRGPCVHFLNVGKSESGFGRSLVNYKEQTTLLYDNCKET